MTNIEVSLDRCIDKLRFIETHSLGGGDFEIDDQDRNGLCAILEDIYHDLEELKKELSQRGVVSLERLQCLEAIAEKHKDEENAARREREPMSTLQPFAQSYFKFLGEHPEAKEEEKAQARKFPEVRADLTNYRDVLNEILEGDKAA